MEHFEMIKKVKKYLPNVEKIDIGISLMKFEETHGKKKLKALNKCIAIMEAEKEDKSVIISTIGHDLGGCEDKFMYPRSASYVNAREGNL